MRSTILGLALVVAWQLIATVPAWAEDKGQGDLDKATEAKLAAESVDDLGEVVKLCRSALVLGLDKESTKYCNNLLASTLLQRANIASEAIFERSTPDPRWPRLRASALSDLDAAVVLMPELGQARLIIAKLNLLPGGDSKRAKTEIAALLAIKELDPTIRSSGLVLRGNTTEDQAKRLTDYNEAIQLSPKNVDAYRQRGLHFILEGKSEPALADLDMALKFDSKHAATLEAKGVVLMLLKRWDDASKVFDKVIEVDPESASAYVNRGRLRAIKKEYPGAITDLNEAIKLDPDNTGTLVLRARVNQLAGKNDDAKDDIEKALRQKPGAGIALEMRGLLSAGSGDYPSAIADFEQLVKLAPKNPELQTQLGMLYVANKQPRAAIAKYTLALEIDPKYFPALRSRGDAYLSVGKHAEAIKDFEAAYKIKADDPSALNNYAWVLATSPEAALRNGKRSIELSTQAGKLTDYKQAYILSTIAAGYAETGDFKSAVEWSKKAVAVGTDDVKADLKKELATYESHKPTREMQNVAENTGKSSAESDKTADKGKDGTATQASAVSKEPTSNSKDASKHDKPADKKPAHKNEDKSSFFKPSDGDRLPAQKKQIFDPR